MAREFLKAVNAVREMVSDVLLPRVCMGCRKEGRYVCEKCSIFISEAPLICPACYKSSFTGDCHLNCKAKYGLQGLVGIWEYEGIVKEMIGQIKERGITHAASESVENAFKIMARDSSRFASFLSFLLSGDTYITYVPMYEKKEKKQGFNQAELFARELGRITKKKVVPLLEKVKDGSFLGNLEKEERVKDSFAASQNFVSSFPHNIVLVDDIWITGITMKECCKVLKRAGVENIWGFTLARTP